MRRIGVLMNLAADDPESLARITIFVQSLHGLGWTVGHNLQMDYRFGTGDANRYRRFASELVALVFWLAASRAKRSARKRAVFSRIARSSAWYSAIAC
jgi:hypothetical protein